MSETRQECLEVVLHQIEQRWGVRALVPARTASLVSGLAAGVAPLDQLLGSAGVPLHALTVLTGTATSGKLTLAYKLLSQAQKAPPLEPVHAVALLDLAATTDPDYVARSGIDLEHLLLVRPERGTRTLRVLLDLVRSCQFRAILVDGLPELLVDREAARLLDEMMPQVNLALKGSGCALILLDELHPPWLPPLPEWTSRAVRHYAALQIELTRREWIVSAGELSGYRVQARLVKSRGPRAGQTASIVIDSRIVRARETW